MKPFSPFRKIFPPYHVLDAPRFYSPSVVALSSAFFAILLVPLYVLATGWFGLKVLVLLGLSCATGFAVELAGITVSGKYTGYFGFCAWLAFPLMVPPGLELWMSLSCLGLAVVVCVVFFGGYGRHVFHPAVVAQVFAMINFSARFGGSFLVPRFDFAAGFEGYSSIPAAGLTAISSLKAGARIPGIDLLLGPNIGFLSDAFPLAVIGAGCLFILFGGVNRRTPIAFLLTVAILSVLGHSASPRAFPGAPQSLLGGSALFYAFFIFSDRWTSPKSDFGRVSAGVAAGVLTLLIRSFSTHSEGAMFAALFCYAFGPLLDELGFKLHYRGMRGGAARKDGEHGR